MSLEEEAEVMDRRGKLGGIKVVLLVGTIKLHQQDEHRGSNLRLVLRHLGLRTVNHRTRLRGTTRIAAATMVEDTMPLQLPARPRHGNSRKWLLRGLLAAVL
jgi:hypothetical protein